MQYVVYDLGERQRGSIAEIQLSAATNVRLIDKVNFDCMKNNREYNYYGGYVSTSPYRMNIPETRHWFVLIDLVGQLKHSVLVHPPKLPNA